jgi:uncharacterized membrane protein YsdA (DUF1294 family)
MKLFEVLLGDSVGIMSLLTVVFALLIILFLGAFFLFGSDKNKGDSK